MIPVLRSLCLAVERKNGIDFTARCSPDKLALPETMEKYHASPHRRDSCPDMKLAQGRLRKGIPLLLSATLLAACSTSFTYNRLDWLIPWYIDDYVDLSREQKQTLKVQLQPLLHWHREEELDDYIGILDHVEEDLQVTLDAASVRRWIDQIMSAVNRVEVSFLDLALELGEDMSAEQMREFSDSLGQRQRELEEEYLKRSDEDYSEDNYRTLEKNLRRFTGRLRQDQKQVLKTAAAKLQRFDKSWLDDRQAWLNSLQPLLQKNTGWQQAIRLAHAQREDQRPDSYLAIRDHNLQVISEAMADVLNSLDNKQGNRVMRELDELREQLRELVRQSEDSEAV